MLGLFKKMKDASDNSDIIDWLGEANKEFELACQTHRLGNIGNFFQGEAFQYVNTIINVTDKEYQGLVRYRHTTFKLSKKMEKASAYIKSVRFDNIEIIKGISVAVGDAYDEEWLVRTCEPNMTVRKIRRLNV